MDAFESRIEPLAYVYKFRCMKVESLWRFFYGEMTLGQFMNDFLFKWEDQEWIEIQKNAECVALCLKTKGINILKKKGLIPPAPQIDNPNSRKKDKALKYYSASEMKVDDIALTHAALISESMLKIKKLAREKGYEAECRGEKFMKEFWNVRPDGVVSIGNTDYFIEVDRNTEKTHSLQGKFARYDRFFSMTKGCRDRKIVIVFVVDDFNKKRRNQRIDKIQKLMMDRFYLIPERDVDFIIGDIWDIAEKTVDYVEYEENIDSVKKDIVLEFRTRFGYTGYMTKGKYKPKGLSKPEDSSPLLHHCGVMKKTQCTGDILQINGVDMEFIWDIQRGAFDLRNTLNIFERNEMIINNMYGKDLKLLIVVTKENEILSLPELREKDMERVFFVNSRDLFMEDKESEMFYRVKNGKKLFLDMEEETI